MLQLSCSLETVNTDAFIWEPHGFLICFVAVGTKGWLKLSQDSSLRKQYQHEAYKLRPYLKDLKWESYHENNTKHLGHNTTQHNTTLIDT